MCVWEREIAAQKKKYTTNQEKAGFFVGQRSLRNVARARRQPDGLQLDSAAGRGGGERERRGGGVEGEQAGRVKRGRKKNGGHKQNKDGGGGQKRA